MIKNIVLGYNGEPGARRAFRRAAEIAQAAQARVHFVYVEAGNGSEEAPLSDPLATEPISVSLPEARPELLPPQAEEGAPTDFFGPIAEEARELGLAATFQRRHGDPAMRLADVARWAGLLAIGRRDESPRLGQLPLGRVARRLALNPPGPLLLAAPEYQPLRRLLLLYEPTAAGGRALAFAGEIAHLLNATLNVAAIGVGDREPSVSAAEARLALRAYHVEGEILPLAAAGPLAVQRVTLMWEAPFLVLPAGEKGLWARPLARLQPALALPDLDIVLVP